MSTPSTTTKPGHTQLTNVQVLSYAVGDISSNIFFQMTALFLMIYMTEIAGISAGVAGAIYGITKVWAGVADLIVGQTVDKTHTRWGRLRPYLLFGSTPLAITFVLMFSVPSGLSASLTVAWIFLFDAAFQLAYSFVNIPYGSLSAAITQDPVDRSKLSGARAITNALAGVALSFVVAPQFEDTTADNIRLKFTIICLILGVIAVALLLVCFANTREVVPRPEENVSVKDAFIGLTKNKPLLILCLGAFFVLGSLFTMNAVAMYFTTNILGDAGWFAYLMAAQTVGMILISSLVPAITTRFGKRNGYIFSGVIAALGFLLIYFVPEGSLTMALVAWFLIGLGMGGTNALMFSMQADTVDYGEWVTGTRAEGGSYSILSFIRKVGQGIGGWLGGAVIGAFGYVQQGAEQTDHAVQGIRLATGLIPAVVVLIAVGVIFFYHLDSEKHAQIVADLNTRYTRDAVARSKGVSTDKVEIESVGDGRNTLLRKQGEDLPPIVTLFGQRGSGATDIAPMLAKRLGVPHVPQIFDYRQLSEADPNDLIEDSSLSRWMRNQGVSSSVTSSTAAPRSNRDIAQRNTREVLAAVENGGVILGRNGTVVLGTVVGALHVRLIAPMNMRIERVMHQAGISASAAREQCEAEDRLRAEMAQQLYRWDPRKDTYYDLIINTGSVTFEQVVEFIADIYHSKYPASGASSASATSPAPTHSNEKQSE